MVGRYLASRGEPLTNAPNRTSTRRADSPARWLTLFSIGESRLVSSPLLLDRDLLVTRGPADVVLVFYSITGKKIAILGWAFKKDTGDSKRSAFRSRTQC